MTLKNKYILDEAEIENQQDYTLKVLQININNPKTAAVVTFGCKQNEADSERIMGMLKGMGFEIKDPEDLEKRDLIIYNTCAVREHAELKAFSKAGQLKHLKEKNKELILGLCGCMIEQEHRTDHVKKSYPYINFTFGTHSIHKLPEIIYNQLTEKKRLFINEKTEYITESIPVHRTSSFAANVSIMYGCDNFCSYCVVPYVRGRERNRKKDDILNEIRELAGNGYREITLLGQNVNSYDDGGFGFTELLSEIIKINGDFLVRFLTSHPKDVPDGLIELMGDNKKLANHFHLPLQSGSDEILNRMNRKYTTKYFSEIVEKMREKIPEIAITTDIIIGFPNETDENFKDTMQMIESCRFDNIFPFIFSKRKNTPAESMEDVITYETKTKRFEELLKLQNSISIKKNNMYIGKKIRVLAESFYHADDTENICGRSSSNKLVIFPGNMNDIGKFVEVKVNDSKLHGLYGIKA